MYDNDIDDNDDVIEEFDPAVFDTTGLKSFAFDKPAEPDPAARSTLINTLVTNPGREVTIEQFVEWRLALGMSRAWGLDLIAELEAGDLIKQVDAKGTMKWVVTDRTMILDKWDAVTD